MQIYWSKSKESVYTRKKFNSHTFFFFESCRTTTWQPLCFGTLQIKKEAFSYLQPHERVAHVFKRSETTMSESKMAFVLGCFLRHSRLRLMMTLWEVLGSNGYDCHWPPTIPTLLKSILWSTNPSQPLLGKCNFRNPNHFLSPQSLTANVTIFKSLFTKFFGLPRKS